MNAQKFEESVKVGKKWISNKDNQKTVVTYSLIAVTIAVVIWILRKMFCSDTGGA